MNQTEPHKVEIIHKSMGQSLRRYFLTGIIVSAPIVITVYIALIFLDFIDSWVAQILPGEYSIHMVPGLGLIIAIAFFVAIGWFATNYLGRLIIKFSEMIVNRLPVIRTIYGAVKQMFEMVMGTQAQAFKKSVLIEFPHKGKWALGFITGETQGEIKRLTNNEDMVNVFIPTTPNPTSGFLIIVPRKDVLELQMSTEDAVKMIVSGGMITPEDKSQPDLK